MLAKLQGRWHLTIHPTSALGMGLFLKDSEEAEAVIEGQVMKVFYKKALVPDLLEDSRDPFLAYTVKVTFGETGSPQPVDLLFGPNEEPVNRRLALGIAEFSDDVIRLCFDRATESESIRPEVFAVGAKGEIWELRREPPTGSRGYVLDRLQGVWQGTWKPDFTLPAEVDVPTIDGIVHIQGSRMAVSWQPDEEIEVRLGATGPAPNPAQNIDLLFKDRKTKSSNHLRGVVDVSGEEIILRLGDCNEEDRPKSIVGTKDEATFTLKLSKLPPGAFPDLGAQCELAGPLPQGAGQGKFRGGLRIANVFAGTPAAQGGFASGDILVGFHVWEITRLEDLQYALSQKLKGEVSFHVIRSGVVRKGYVLLDGSKRPDTDAELSPDQLTSIPVEYDRGIEVPESSSQSDDLLSQLQGTWDVDLSAADFADQPPGTRAEFTVEGNLLKLWEIVPPQPGLTTETLRTEAGAMLLTLGAAGPPQQVDLVIDPNGDNRRETEGIMEINGDRVKLCYFDPQNGTSTLRRPLVFAAGKQVTMWTLKRRKDDAIVTDLEGDWHLVLKRDHTGREVQFSPYNRSYWGGRVKSTWSGGGHDSRIEVFPDSKTYHYFSKDEDTSFFVDHYEIKNDQLIVRDSPDGQKMEVFERGHVRIPPPLVPVPEAIQARWRSGIVQILREWVEPQTGLQQHPVCFGALISADGLILSQIPTWNRDLPHKFLAQFDDGSHISLTMIEEGTGGLRLFRPVNAVEVNHYFPIAESTTEADDEVHVWSVDVTGNMNAPLSLWRSTVMRTNRRIAALGLPVWQLAKTTNTGPQESLPVLSSNGDLLAIALRDTGDLLLAIPATQLKELFPKAWKQPRQANRELQSPVDKADQKDNGDSQDSRLSPFQGHWKVDFFASPNRAEQWERVEIKGSTLTCFGAIDEKSSFARVYRLTLGGPDDPRAVDLRETEGNQTWPGLIEKTRDGLALCLGLDGQRPAEFGDGDQRICLRLIPQPAEPEPSPAPADSKASSSDSEK